ncbi:MAG: hypothetical protein AAFY71_03565 [Bacteroidota bacterium]
MINIFRYGLGFVAMLLLQIYLFNHLVLFQVAIPFVFFVYLIMLPLNTPRATDYALAFFMGLLVDIFSDHAATGIHAFSALLAMSLRHRLAGLLTTSNFRGVEEISLASQNSLWLFTYIFPLVLVHQFCFFLLEDFTFAGVLYILWKAILSSIYTCIIGILIVFVFYKE